MGNMTNDSKVTTKIDWKNFFLALFIGATLILVGIVVYYQFELSKLSTPLPVNFSPNQNPTSYESSPSSEVATFSAQEASPSSGN